MTKHRGLRIGLILGAIAAISLLHYHTATHHLWLHQLLQRGYYLPVLLAAALRSMIWWAFDQLSI